MSAKTILLVSGLGHTDLSGKVPRPGLLALRKSLRDHGHEARVVDYSASLPPRIFTPDLVKATRNIYERSVRPVIIEGEKWLLPLLAWDMHRLKNISRQIMINEQAAFAGVGQELARQVRDEGLDAVGLPLYVGSSTSAAIIIADRLRREIPSLPIFFGGPQTTHFAETIYRQTKAPTALVLGEGELSIAALAEIIDSLKTGHLNDLNRIPNLVYRSEDGNVRVTRRQRLSLDEWLKVSSNLYDAHDFDGLMKYAFIETSRGCNFGCHFCSQPMLSGRERYLKPAGNIVDEMVALNRKYGLTHFEFVGSTTPPAQAEAVADELIARGLQDKFKWALFMRGKDERTAQGLTPASELMRKIKSAGALSVFFGVEAADNPTLKRMAKGETIEEIEASMLAAKNAGLGVIGSFIYPYPGMPDNEADLIVDFLKRTAPLSAPVQAIGLYPGTYDAENADKIGCEIIYPDPADVKRHLMRQLPKPSMHSPEVLDYLFKFPLILSLPQRLWPFHLPYKIDGMPYKTYIGKGNKLQRRISQLGILLGFSHSHALIADRMGLTPKELLERMFYCSLTGDQEETQRRIALFNSQIGG